MWFLRTKTWFFKNRQKIKKFANCMLKNFTKLFFQKISTFREICIFRFFFARKCWFFMFFLIFGRFYGPVSPRIDVLFEFWLQETKEGTLETVFKNRILKSPKIEKVTAIWRWLCVKSAFFTFKSWNFLNQARRGV